MYTFSTTVARDAPASLTLNDITLDSAYSPNADGGAILSSGPLTLNNVTIQNSKAGLAFCGGAIRSDGLAIITNSRFIKNAAGDGGAICTAAAGAPTLRITNSSFNENQATRTAPDAGVGGAILLKQTATLEVKGSTFFSNKADGGGALGILESAMATARLEAGQKPAFLFNSATVSGGAIYNLGTLNVYGAEFNGNTVPENALLNGYGGGIASQGVLTVHDSYFSVNRSRFGGGVFVGGNGNPQADIQRTIFSQNTAAVFGGGLYTNNEDTLISVSNSIFRRNNAGTGGGLARFNEQLQLSNSSVTQNTAVGVGGGMYLGAGPSPGSSSYVKVRSVTISTNQAGNPGGGGVFNEGRAELYHVTIVNNPGGVYTGMDGNTRFRGSVLHNPGFPNCTSALNTQISNDAGNHISDDSCGFQFTAAGDPKLGPLQSDGVNTLFYHMPLEGSPLINMGPSNCPEIDQRGALRVGPCDIGAVEFGGVLQPGPPPTLPPIGQPVFLPIIVR
jgi:predicted outer membrane repeat protein